MKWQILIKHDLLFYVITFSDKIWNKIAENGELKSVNLLINELTR